MPHEAIDQIEILKRPVSALYGRGTLYGATNCITRSPDDNAVRTRWSAAQILQSAAALRGNFRLPAGLFKMRALLALLQLICRQRMVAFKIVKTASGTRPTLNS